ncbi:MAG: hypothetical protein IT432_08660 [Phycisphaerales bacterium]|nr:hypothetical protein [Phycisphaerales bacterium]
MSPVRQHHVPLGVLWSRLSGAGKVAVVVILAAIVVLVFPVIAMVGTLLTPAASPSAAQNTRRQEMLKKFEESSERSLAQTSGRSLFVIPAAPRPPRNDAPPAVSDTTPRPPSAYGGPALAAIINDTVWFSDGTRLKPGENADKSLSVVRVDPPWGATIKYRGVDFPVTLFEHDKTVIPPPTPPKPVETKPTETKPTETKPGDGAPPDAKPTDVKPGEAPAAPESKPAIPPETKPETKPETLPDTKPETRPETPQTRPAPGTPATSPK